MTQSACIVFQDVDDNKTGVYIHGGYTLHEIYEMIHNALEYTWELPRFDAEDFAAAFCAANKESSGTIYVSLYDEKNIQPEYVIYVNYESLFGDVYVSVYEDGGTLAAYKFAQEYVGDDMLPDKEAIASFLLKDIDKHFVKTTLPMQRVYLTDKQLMALRTIHQIAIGSEDVDDSYATHLVGDILYNMKYLDNDCRHTFYRMTESDLKDLLHTQTKTGIPIQKEYLESEYGPSYSTVQSAIEAEEGSLLVDPDDTDYVAIIVDTELLVITKLWMKDGRVRIQYPLEDDTILNGLHYDDTF